MKDAYQNTELNAKVFSYGGGVVSLNNFFASTKYFMSKKYIRDGYSFLDIGGASGIFAKAIFNEVAKIDATIIDPNEGSVVLGQELYPEFRFIKGFFPDNLSCDDKFDVVSMQALFPQMPNWKDILLSMKKHALKYINLSLIFRLSGTTVIDKDVSYFYYLDSGVRVHQVIHNIYEFINFCCIEEMGVKRIDFYGYHTPITGDNFRCVPNNEQIKGNIMLELFEESEGNFKRFGGAHKSKEGEYRFFLPEMNIIIDDVPFNVRG